MPEIKSLNNFLYDNDLTIDELEERLEMSAPWICGRCEPYCPGVDDQV